jgi:hypothetical protein
MNHTQRIVLIVYCCVWVAGQAYDHAENQVRAGYGWLWSGPPDTEVLPSVTTPDLPVIGLRLLAVSAISGAAFLLAGMFKSTARSFHA